MAIKKSELYSSLWASCDELRGGMDASQYKDYVLTLLFVKYVSDKYANKKNSLIQVPDGATFEDMVALKGQKDIGDQINKKILKPLFSANGLEGSMELVDFNDDDKLGSDKEKVELLSNLVEIFENPALDFKNNRAEDDDILGDAYEFLMQHFASESGKSKGQFYTPAEVSRILAKIIDVNKADKPSYTVYDMTCGSGSLLLKVAAESEKGLTIYGQEKDIATKGLAIMNMWLHGYPEASIAGKNTISNPQFKEKDGSLKRFDFVVANPPFSVKNWSNGISPMEDEYNRFQEFGVPPDKNGDYAFLLHLVASLKSTGKGAVILPHGVLFRGNAEASIRQNLIERKLIKGIIGLPANLFYGTGIPACIIVIDKENAEERKGIFMVDASKGFIKDGNKNRLREQDLHKIVDVFNKQKPKEKYARFVEFDEIERNEFNLNIPRYIDTQDEEDIQDLDAHLNGGIPNRDLERLNHFWEVYPSLKNDLFAPLREGYSSQIVETSKIKETIFNHPEFTSYGEQLDGVFESWKSKSYKELTSINEDDAPKKFIESLSEDLLSEYKGKALIDRYDVYQHLMNYWNDIMKDDVYLIIEDGWVAKLKIVKQTKKETIYDCDLVPKQLVVNRYFDSEQKEIQNKETEKENLESAYESIIEENSGEEDIFGDNDGSKITKTDLGEKLIEYQDLAFNEHFPDSYKEYQTLGKQLEDATAKVVELISDENWANYYERLANAKGKLAKGKVQDRVLELKKQIEKSDLPEQYMTQVESIKKDFAKYNNWNKNIQHPYFVELDTHYDYLTQLNVEAKLKKEHKTARENLEKELDKLMGSEKEYISEIKTINSLLNHLSDIAELKKDITELTKQLEELTIKKYGELTEDEVKMLVVDDKWLTTLNSNVQSEIDAISQRLTGRIKELAERYENTLGTLDNSVKDLESKVNGHLQKMGLVWR